MGAPRTITVEMGAEVLERFPGLAVEFLLVRVAPYENAAAAAAGAARVGQTLGGRYSGPAGLVDHPLEEGYRAFYRAMGLKAAQVTNPVKQAKRVLEHGYRGVSRAVDVSMEIEYSTLVSFQLYDAALVPTRLSYQFARGDEPIVTMRGEEKVCKARELILTGPDRVVHSSYYGNHRDFAVAPETPLVLVRLLWVPGVPGERFAEASACARRRLDWVSGARLGAGCVWASLAPAPLEVALPTGGSA